MIALAGLGGAVAAAALVLLVAESAGMLVGRPEKRRATPTARRFRFTGRQVVLLAAAPLAAWALTGWPVAALATAAACIGLPKLAGGRKTAGLRISRLEGLGAWVRRVADLLGAGIGLEQALQASARTAPAQVHGEVGRLAWRLHAGTPTEAALRAFADELDDPAGDLVAAALILASQRRGRGLARTLTALAGTLDGEVAMRRRVEADRATPRTTVRYVVVITLVAAAGLALLDRAYLEPFATVVGQLFLALALALFAGAFAWMRRLVADPPPARFLPSRPGGHE